TPIATSSTTAAPVTTPIASSPTTAQTPTTSPQTAPFVPTTAQTPSSSTPPAFVPHARIAASIASGLPDHFIPSPVQGASAVAATPPQSTPVSTPALSTDHTPSNVRDTIHLKPSGDSAQTAIVNESGKILSIVDTKKITPPTHKTHITHTAHSQKAVHDVSKSWDAGFQSIKPYTPTDQVINPQAMQLQLGLLASVYSQMAPYWSVPAAVSFLSMTQASPIEKSIPEAAVKAYAVAISTLVSNPDFMQMVQNLILRSVKNPNAITPEQLNTYASALKITLLINALVVVQLTILRKAQGHFSPQELVDIILGHVPIPPEDDISVGLIKLIQAELTNLPKAIYQAFLANLLSTYSNSTDVQSLIDPSIQFLKFCDQSYFQNQTAAESI
ncbi:MAG: hypothetical protein JSR46_01505, partial [Verrucomicrobia bacterium]|nr:hypothetical protein [Verrucomicrobiota bacterium]